MCIYVKEIYYVKYAFYFVVGLEVSTIECLKELKVKNEYRVKKVKINRIYMSRMIKEIINKENRKISDT